MGLRQVRRWLCKVEEALSGCVEFTELKVDVQREELVVAAQSCRSAEGWTVALKN